MLNEYLLQCTGGVVSNPNEGKTKIPHKMSTEKSNSNIVGLYFEKYIWNIYFNPVLFREPEGYMHCVVIRNNSVEKVN